MLMLDGRPWINPQVLRAGVIYDLKAKIMAPTWPTAADRLVLNFVTTLSPEHRQVSPIVIHRSEVEGGAEANWGYIEFPVGQSMLAEPALLQMRASFLSATNAAFVRTATIAGYAELHVRASDSKSTPLLSKYRALAQRVIAIVDELRSLRGLGEEHLAEFVEMLSAILNYLGICAQQALYREGWKILEKDFQRDLLIHLRGQLGEEVLEAPEQGGGITDIRYRSITAELKVEDNVSDRDEMFEGYRNQQTQYSSATGGAARHLVCVLDLTEKELPPCTSTDSVQLLTPLLHGFESTATSEDRVITVARASL